MRIISLLFNVIQLILFNKTNYKTKLRHKLIIYILRFECSITQVVTEHCGFAINTDGISHIYMPVHLYHTGHRIQRSKNSAEHCWRHVAFDCIYVEACSEKNYSLKLFQLSGVFANKKKHRLENIFHFAYLIKYFIHVLIQDYLIVIFYFKTYVFYILILVVV